MKIEDIGVDRFFPYKDNAGRASYRPYQREIIIKALRALIEQDYDVFFLDAPVGHGKSPDLITIARVLEALGKTSYYTTPQLILQNQLLEFKDLPQIKGRDNYICPDDLTVTAGDGECQIDKSYECPKEGECPYLQARTRCQESPKCGMNTSYMMTVSREVFGERYLYICDEAHSIPEWGVNFVGLSLRERDVGIIPDLDKYGFQAYTEWMTKILYPRFEERRDQLEDRLKSFGKGKRKTALGEREELKRMRDNIRKIEQLTEDYTKNQEDWTWDKQTDTRGRKIVFQPITSGRFLEKLLWSRGQKIILSSGTITPEIYIKEGGLQELEYDSRDCVMTVPTDFPPERSPIIYKAIGKMTKDLKQVSFPRVLKEVEKIITENHEHKGIIHTFSYENARYIQDNIRSDLRDYLIMQDRDEREESLEEWLQTREPAVFISTNMTQGLDLKDDLCRYQIYVKIGYPNITDKRVAKRLSLNHWLWYSMQAIEDLEQASGRATRSKEDWSKMYILDSSFAMIYTKYGKYLKPWFKDRLKFIAV